MKNLTILIVVFVFIISCQPKQSNESVSRVATPKNQKTQTWYKGGTLHKANGTQWEKATDHDKLATCADFTMTLAQRSGETPSVRSEKFKQASESLMDCINNFFELSGSELTTVSKAAIQCWSN